MLFALCSLPGFSQNFPVQVIPQTIPPAPIYVSSYADANTLTGPLRVQIILNDFEIANREIRLKTYFTGSGLNFQSNDIVVGASPLFLEGGVPLVLTHVELAPYFEFNNISGISPNQYGNAIPEGAYQFCVEVYDALTGSRISQRSCAVSVVFQNEPPFLVLPRNKINVDEVNPQYIVFQWTPRSINVSNVAYELSLVEIWDNQVDPQQAFLSSPPVFQTTTSATTYVYGPSDPLLLSGKNYAWRVQAKAKQGLEEIGLFKNQGYSEIYSFGYAGSCELPLGVNHEVKGSTNANIFWDDFSTEIPEYTVRYRKKGNDNEWFESKTAGNFLTLWNLRPGTIYEYQLRKKCSVTESDWSFEKQFTTFLADDEDSIYECGIPPNFDIGNKEPLQNLGVNEEFTAGDFPIKVLEASGSNGRFTGKGYVTIPYLRNIRVGVEFTNVLINSDRKLLEGSVNTMYDPSLGNILDIDDAIDTVENVTDSVGELFEGDNDLDEIQVDWTIGSKDEITIEDGMVVITNPNNGVTKKEPLGDDMIITDQEGNTYYVSPEGEITEGGQITPGEEVNPGNVSGVSNNGDLEGLTAENIKVTFNSKGTYGFDKMPSAANTNEKLKKEYTIIKDATGGDYVLPHHAVKKGGTTQIQATIEIENNAYTPDQVVFKNKQGKIFTPTSINGNTATISLDGVYSFENETIYAVVPSKEDTSKQLTAGAFTLWHLAEKTIDVAIVSVGASFGDVATAVNGIFGNGLAKINFKNSISVDVNAARTVLGSNGMDVGESPLTAAYNDEQKALRALSKSAGANDSDTYYVIVLGSDFSNTKGIAGFMPLQRQFGFVFEQYASNGDEGKGSVANTVAHEIGHGVFALQHPFTQYGSARESTDWLMDYSNGTNLPHTHWSQMHDPALKFYLFQDEEEGEYDPWEYLSNQDFLISRFDGILKNDDYSFVTIAGTVFTLPKRARDISFLNGFLKGFTVDNERYIAAQSKKTKAFKGFYADFKDKNSRYPDKTSASLDFNKLTIHYGLVNESDADCTNKNLLYQSRYTGSERSSNAYGTLDTNVASLFSKGKKVNDRALNLVDFSTALQLDYTDDVFNCLKNNDLKTLFKYVEYKFPDFQHLNPLFSDLNKLNNVEILGFLTNKKEGTQSNAQVVEFNIAKENSVIFFKKSLDAFINGKSETDLASLDLRIDLTLNGRSIFDLSKGKELLTCLLDWKKQFQPENTFLPSCLWYNLEKVPKYTRGDPAFQVGMVDGAVVTVRDLFKIVEGAAKIQIAYSLGLTLLTEEQIQDEVSRLTGVLTKIGANSSTIAVQAVDPTELVSYIMSLKASKEAYTLLQTANSTIVASGSALLVKEVLEFLKSRNPEKFEAWQDWVKNNDIVGIEQLKEDQQKIRDQFIEGLEFLEMLTNPNGGELRDTVLKTIIDEIGAYLTLIGDTNSVARYNHGKIVFQIVSEVALAIATGGTANLASLMAKVGALSRSTIRLFVQLALKSYKQATKLVFKNGYLLLDNLRVYQLFKFKGSDILKLELEELPIPRLETGNYTVIDDGIAAAYLRSDGTVGEGQLKIVESEGSVFVLVDELADGGSKLAKSGDELIYFAKNVNKGSDEMLSIAKKRIADYRIAMKGKKKLGGNLGYVEGELNGVNLNNELVSSSAPKVGSPEIFDAKYVNRANEVKPSAIDGAYLRTGDSEFQMLTNLAEEFNLVKSVKYPDMTGTIRVVSEFPYCASCSGVIHQLSDMLPNVKIIIINGAK